MKKSLFASGIKLSLLTLVSRILGLIREMIKASFLGTSALADAFGLAFLIPNLLRRLFAENSISVAFIPTFKAYLEKEDLEKLEQNKQETQSFVQATFSLISFVSSLSVIAGILCTPLLIPFFTKDSNADILTEMTFLTRVMFPYLFVISIAAFFQGILNGLKIFAPSGFTPILFNLAVIGSAYALSPYTKNPARAMAYGVLAGGTIQALFQLPFVIKQGFKPVFTNLKTAFTNQGTRQVLKLIAPTILGMAAYQLNDIVSTALAGRAGTGIVSSLQYSLRLQELILGIFAVSIGTIILPDLSSLAQKQNWQAFNSMFAQAMEIIALITIPISFFSLICGENIIILVYKSQRFSDASVALTLSAFQYHITGLFFIALNRIIAPAFYARSNPRSPTIAGIGGFAVNIAIAVILVQPMKGAGIALALSIASFANTVFLFIFLRKDKTIQTASLLRRTILYCSKILAVSIIASVPVYLLKNKIFAPFFGMHRFLAQGVPLLICAFLFTAPAIMLLAITGDPLIKKLQKSKKT